MNKEKRISKDGFELAPSPISQAGFLRNRTGSWRYLRPRYEEKLAPCIAACPAGERIEMWIQLLQQEKYIDAWRLIKTVNPFPRICGRVCFHPCESECNRGHFDRAIAIHSLERFVADQARSLSKSKLPLPQKTGKSVGIIGSGPAGLACAYHLANRGHSVTIYEAETRLGGLLRYGIPAYRLPKDVLDEEINDIIELGIEVKTGTRVEDLDELCRTHHALFVAAGLGKSRRIGIPGEHGEGVMDALEFLKGANSGRSPEIRGKVVVVGGGNAAIDAARVALRLGADPTIIYRRSRAEMPAYPPEIEEAEREGIAIRYLTQPVEIVRENGRIVLVECVLNRLGQPDDSGRAQPVPIPNSNLLLEAHMVIVAVGEQADETLTANLPEGVFAGGDLVSPWRTVAHAIGSGRKTAMLIDKRLGGSGEDPADYLAREVVTFESLNLDYFPHKPRIRLPMLPLRKRERNFDEIYSGVGMEAASEEAGRCFHCGACISCDNCKVFCPDIAVKRAGDGKYAIDYDYCKGCGICVHECPRNAMSIDEEIRK